MLEGGQLESGRDHSFGTYLRDMRNQTGFWWTWAALGFTALAATLSGKGSTVLAGLGLAAVLVFGPCFLWWKRRILRGKPYMSLKDGQLDARSGRRPRPDRRRNRHRHKRKNRQH